MPAVTTRWGERLARGGYAAALTLMTPLYLLKLWRRGAAEPLYRQAVGERLGASGRTVLEAFMVGFEVECKIADAIYPTHYKQGFHTSARLS